MPRTRATPPPSRRASGERSRSVRQLTHRRGKKEAKQTPHVETKADLIHRYAEARTEQQRQSFGALGMIGVVLTCALVFLGWWFVPGLFKATEPASPAATDTTSTPPATTGPGVSTSTPSATTSTERRLLLPLTTSTQSP